MPDYQKGKIYKITSGDLTYIGSTCEPTLSRRLSCHVSKYKLSKKNDNIGIVSSFQLIETGIYEITLIELFPCGSKDELTARERFHIENTVCVNKVIPRRTQKEYYQANKEELMKRSKEYRDINKVALAEKKAQRDGDREAYLKRRNEAYHAKKVLK
jgi:hypothetical protein